ncbi:hypothetical protein [Halomarina oriensis]|uniref:Uncharacterized protein n=1 Tax=Halomarina oriensis TaxID=671145 RepID=A0A6B0GJL2_9EURY|nr:hypothetical protein [Halomarina oriensis]MWG34790.1 hypothetical protein [Halomarina oriensis]
MTDANPSMRVCSDAFSRVEQRILDTDHRHADGVVRAARGDPSPATGRELQQVIYRAEGDLVARITHDDRTVYLRKSPRTTQFERAIAKDGESTVTDYGVTAAASLFDGDLAFVLGEDVDVFENPDVDSRKNPQEGRR